MSSEKKSFKEKFISFFKWLGAILLGIGLAVLYFILGKNSEEEKLRKEKEDIKKDIEKNKKEVDNLNKDYETIKNNNKKNKEDEEKFFPYINN